MAVGRIRKSSVGSVVAAAAQQAIVVHPCIWVSRVAIQNSWHDSRLISTPRDIDIDLLTIIIAVHMNTQAFGTSNPLPRGSSICQGFATKHDALPAITV